MKALDCLGRDLVCDECKGKPDYLYFDIKERKIVSIICTQCRSIYEAMIRDIAKNSMEVLGVQNE